MNNSEIINDPWDASLYDKKHGFVSKYGNDVIDILEPNKGESILDLGCGTGDLAKTLHDLGVQVIGIDTSENMISQAQAKYPSITFQVGNAIELPFDEKFDAVFSNATIHWIKTPEQALQSIYRSLKKGGRFVAEFGAKGNVNKITDSIEKQFAMLGLAYTREHFPWYFPSIGEYTTLMENAGFKVTYARHFERPTPLESSNGLRNWIEMFGKSMFSGLDHKTIQKIIAGVEYDLWDTMFQDSHWIADYERIQVKGLK
ncbi:class I SAM-dependent methyltransferase [Lentibacillus sp. N15]|uniref:class I SAM-dependent methyltransferase n=1 Tax=Lentibacillus songyuanensis TaxID=3136161 RepID=UPI0031BA2F94